MTYLMESLEFAQQDIHRVANAITRHETGGDPDSDLVRDADSIRWFDSGYQHYIKAYGLDSAGEKARWMYTRATPQTKALISNLLKDERLRKYFG